MIHCIGFLVYTATPKKKSGGQIALPMEPFRENAALVRIFIPGWRADHSAHGAFP